MQSALIAIEDEGQRYGIASWGRVGKRHHVDGSGYACGNAAAIRSVEGTPQDIGGFKRGCLPVCSDATATDMWSRWIFPFSMTSETSMIPKVVVDICICRSSPSQSKTHIKVNRRRGSLSHTSVASLSLSERS